MILRMKGEGKVTTPNDAVSYGAGAENDPMADLVDGGINDETEEVAEDGSGEEAGSDAQEAEEAAMSEIDADTGETQDSPVVIDSTEATVEELLPESKKAGFDDREVQDARLDREDEGGVTKPQTTGPMKLPSGDASQEGGQIKHGHLADSSKDSYEVSGFHVEVPTSGGVVSQQITQNFYDLETAKASINGDRYLRPEQGGFRACRITRGAPIICYNERQILEYINGRWRRP